MNSCLNRKFVRFATLLTLMLAVSRLAQAEIKPPIESKEIGNESPSTENVSYKSLKTFDERRKWIIDTVATNPEAFHPDHPFFVAEACFLAGKIDEGRAIARKGYLSWSSRDPLKVRATDFFRLWPAMDCYVRYKQYLDEESKAAFKKHMTGIRCYSYAYTANLSMLMWTTLLLGEQEWGFDAFVPMAAKDTTSHYKADPDIPMKNRLMGMINHQAIAGGEEYASRPYGAGNLAPILCLAQLAKDPELKLHARIAHETALARYSSTWLQGAMIMTSRGSYPDLWNDPMGVATWFWVFFGGELQPSLPSHALEAAVLGEPAPPLIEFAATNRVKPYSVFSRFQEGSSGRQISWIESRYGLFSESFHTNPHPFGQTYPFGVRWIVPNSPNYTLLWFSVPSVDENNTGSHPHGFSVRNQTTFQHEDSLLYVVNTEAARHPYGLAFIPGGALAVIDEASNHGQVFLHYPGVLIAFQCTKSFPWDRATPIKSPSGTPRTGDSEFRVPGPTFAAAIETAPENEFPGASPEQRLNRFRDAILAKSKLSLSIGGTLSGSYTNRHGKVLSRLFNGEAQVDGKAVNFADWPLIESPWVKQPSKSSPLIVSDGRNTITYDFQNWIIK
jgi:hypothetical protein